MKLDPRTLLASLPGPVTAKWPEGERFVEAFSREGLSLELYAPVGHDPQQPHAQDELYCIVSGTAILSIGDVRHDCAPGDVFFVPADMPHRFETFSEGFAAWAVFWPASGAG